MTMSLPIRNAEVDGQVGDGRERHGKDMDMDLAEPRLLVDLLVSSVWQLYCNSIRQAQSDHATKQRSKDQSSVKTEMDCHTKHHKNRLHSIAQ